MFFVELIAKTWNNNTNMQIFIIILIERMKNVPRPDCSDLTKLAKDTLPSMDDRTRNQTTLPIWTGENKRLTEISVHPTNLDRFAYLVRFDQT